MPHPAFSHLLLKEKGSGCGFISARLSAHATLGVAG